MTRNRLARYLLVPLALPMVLSGCAGHYRAAMMPGRGTTATVSPGAGMMGGGPGYRYSPSTCVAPSALPGSVVTVLLADMNMGAMAGGVAPTTAHMMLRSDPVRTPAGTVSFVAVNRGWRVHELVILPLAATAAAGQRVAAADGTIAETGSLGEASGACAGGAGDGIPAGSAGWLTLTLRPGRYELVCNQPNHYADGMWQEFDVS